MKYGMIFGLIIWILIIFGISQCNADFYIEIGVGGSGNSVPEIDLPNPLGKFAFGFERDGWLLEFEHISSIVTHEEGYGLNAIWISKKFYY